MASDDKQVSVSVSVRARVRGRYQPRIGHVRSAYCPVKLDPGLMARVKLLAADRQMTVSSIIAESLERTVLEAAHGKVKA